MSSIVPSNAADIRDQVAGQRAQELLDGGGGLCDRVPQLEGVSSYDACFQREGFVDVVEACCSGGEDGVAEIGFDIFCADEADEVGPCVELTSHIDAVSCNLVLWREIYFDNGGSYLAGLLGRYLLYPPG